MSHQLIINVPLSLKIVPDAFMQRLAELKRDQLTAVFPHTMQRLGELGQIGATLWREKASQIPGAEGRPLRLGTGPADPMVRLNRTDYVNSIHVEPSHDQRIDRPTTCGTHADRRSTAQPISHDPNTVRGQ